MPPDQAELRSDEYRALRATIRERGTLRVSVILITVVSWAALAVTGGGGTLLSSLATLLVLVAGFEQVFATHMGVERVGRYIQRRYERAADPVGPRWEHVAMELGRNPALPRGPGAMAVPTFIIAAAINACLTVRTGLHTSRPGLGLALGLTCHAAFLWRVIRASQLAARQREADLAALEAIDV